MFTLEVLFPHPRSSDDATDEKLAWAVSSLLAAWYKNGQVLEHLGVGRTEAGFVVCPYVSEEDSLDDRHASEHVAEETEKLRGLGLYPPRIRSLGPDVEAEKACPCDARPFLYLWTGEIRLESPVRCGECRLPVPIYRLPSPHSDAHLNLRAWAESYKATGRLFTFHDGEIEAFAYAQLSSVSSALTKEGRGVARELERASGTPVFYDIDRHYSEGPDAERENKCPGCGRDWRVEDREAVGFDFFCEPCRLVAEQPIDEMLPEWWSRWKDRVHR